MAKDLQSQLGPVVQGIMNMFNQRTVTKDGEKVGTIPSTGDPARSVRGLLARRAAGKGGLDDLQKDLNLLYRQAAVNYMVNWGLASPEDAEAFVAKTPDPMLALIGEQSGHQQALSEINRFMLQSGYVDPETLDSPSAQRQQVKHNQRLAGVAESLFSFIRPDNNELPIQGIRPDEFMQAVLSRPGMIQELSEGPGFLDGSGKVSAKGYRQMASKLSGMSEGIRLLSDLTGKESVPEALQAGGQLLGGNPMDMLADDETRSKLSRMATLTHHLGGTKGDLIGLLDASRQISEKKGWGGNETVKFASSVAPWLLSNPKGLDDKQKTQYNRKIMSQAANSETSPYTKAFGSMYAALRASGFSDRNARGQLSTAASLTNSPNEAMAWLNKRLPGKVKVTTKNWKTFLNTPEAEQYMHSSDALAHALAGISKEARFREKKALSEHIGKDYAQQYMQGDTGVLDWLARRKHGDNIEKRTEWMNKVRNSQQEVAGKMDVDREILPALRNMRTSGRTASAQSNYENMRDKIPWTAKQAPGIFSSAFAGRIDKNNALPSFVSNILGKGEPVNLDNT